MQRFLQWFRGLPEYRQRLALSAVAALWIHVALLGAGAYAMVRDRFDRLGAPELRDDPIVMNLEPQARQLIDTPVPSEEAANPDTPFIGEDHAQASDMTDAESVQDSFRPDVGEPARFDDLSGTPPASAAQPASPPEPAAQLEAAPPTLPALEAPPPQQEEQPAKPPEKAAPIEALDPLEAFDEPSEPPEEPRQVAHAEMPLLPSLPPPTPPQTPAAEASPATPPAESAEHSPLERVAQTTASEAGDAPNRGFVGFEAKQSELAPYLKEVRRKIENQWRALLQIRYSGTKATEATLDLAIKPDGTIASVRIVEPGDSPTFGALCKVAIERAGPFGPFPFEVPEIYRSENLEIRWTFSYFK